MTYRVYIESPFGFVIKRMQAGSTPTPQPQTTNSSLANVCLMLSKVGSLLMSTGTQVSEFLSSIALVATPVVLLRAVFDFCLV